LGHPSKAVDGSAAAWKVARVCTQAGSAARASFDPSALPEHDQEGNMTTDSRRTMPARRRDDQWHRRDAAFAVIAIIALIVVFLLATVVGPFARA
jgi:hypothetical protein